MSSLGSSARTEPAHGEPGSIPREALAAFACPACGGHDWQPVGSLVERLNSHTGAVACGACDERIFVKRIRRYPRLDPVERASREFRHADALYRTMPADETMAVARPLAAIGDTLFFEFVAGVPLGEVLRSRTGAERTALLERVGAWFARLHDSDSGHVRGDPDFARRLRYLRERCATLSGRHRSVAHALERQRRRLDSFAGRTVPLVLVHGDAKPGNFLVCGERVVAVDVDYRVRGLPEMDLAQFLVQMRCSHPFHAPATTMQRERLEEAFLAGYTSRRPFDADVLAWMRTYFTLSLWTDARRGGWLRRLRADAVFGTELRRLERLDGGAAR